jgi:tetratricopeptide (TPR) repeat protein
MTRIFVGPDAGIDLLRKAAALDPLSSSAHRMLGLRCFLAGRLDDATAALKTSLDLNPKAGLVHCFLCATRLAQGRAAEALELAEREVLPDFRLMGIALAQHALGHKEESDAAVAQLIERHGKEAAYQVAETYAWLGERDRVFEWLERAYTQRDPGLAMTSTDPFFRPMHDDARWVPFLKKMGFPEPLAASGRR